MEGPLSGWEEVVRGGLTVTGRHVGKQVLLNGGGENK